MLVLSRQDVEKLLTMHDTIAAVEDGYRQLAAGNVTMPQRVATNVLPHNGIHLSMPAFVGRREPTPNPAPWPSRSSPCSATIPRKYGEPTIQGVVLLHDARTGKPLALMDAEQLTAMRTGAASGVATKTLARPDAAVASILGSGVQAGTQLLGSLHGAPDSTRLGLLAATRPGPGLRRAHEQPAWH